MKCNYAMKCMLCYDAIRVERARRNRSWPRLTPKRADSPAATGRSQPPRRPVGRPPRYCDLPEHTAQTAFRERRRRATAGEFDGDEDRAGGERPVSLAIA